MRDLVLSDEGISRLTNNHYRDDLFIGDDEPRAKWALTARWIESLALSALTVATGTYVMRAMADVIRPAFLLGVPVGMAIAFSAHQIRTNLLLNRKITPNAPYSTPFSVLYHDIFSILKGRWQILEATTAATVALAILGITYRLSVIYPLATATFAALATGSAGAYMATDYVLSRLRQI